MNKFEKKETFGDFFLYEHSIYRTFTNYHQIGCVQGHLVYALNDSKIVPIPNNTYPLLKAPIERIEGYFKAQSFSEKVDPEVSYIYSRLDAIGIKRYGITGSSLLKLYGFEKDNSKSDIDIIVEGRKDTKRLFNKLNDLYDSNFKSYIGSEDLLLERRSRKSNITTNLNTIKNFECLKPVGRYNGKHVNITPTYRIDRNIMKNISKKPYRDLGYVEVDVEILDCTYADTVPGFYRISAKSNRYKIKTLRSNIFYFMLSNKSIENKLFRVRGKLLSELNSDGEEEYVLELSSRWDITKFSMILLN